MANFTKKLILRHFVAILLVASIALIVLGGMRRYVKLLSIRESSMERYTPVRNKQIRGEIVNNYSGAELAVMHVCPVLPEELHLVGDIQVNLNSPTWQDLESMYPDVKLGGLWRPNDCVSRSRVAIVVPYRDRDYNLRLFLQHLHPFLQKQKLQYGIFIVEQAYNTTFNRGMMKNIGFMEANLHQRFDCTTFHDVDLLPENDMNYYGCSDMPRHMCIALDYFQYKPIASGAVFGGIVSFRNDHFLRVNGYSNLYFGWGAEDDDLMSRCRRTGVGFYRARPQYGRYKGTTHKKDHRIKTTYQLWSLRAQRAETDGLNSLRYKVVKREARTLYTWILVDIDEERYQKEAREYISHIQEQKHIKNKQQEQQKNIKENRLPEDTSIRRRGRS